MENFNPKWKRILFKPLAALAIILRILTSWYCTILWSFYLPYVVVGESFWLSLCIAIVSTYGSFKIWQDYDPIVDGQITFKEFFKKSKNDLTK